MRARTAGHARRARALGHGVMRGYVHSADSGPSSLLLVFVVERRRDFHSCIDARERLLIMTVTVSLLVAAWQTFTVLIYDDPARGSLRTVAGCLVGAVAALLVSLLTPPQADKEPER
jgi:hypothetical protein